jgi:hypothetical protein
LDNYTKQTGIDLTTKNLFAEDIESPNYPAAIVEQLQEPSRGESETDKLPAPDT